jgi:hypothetical protein
MKRLKNALADGLGLPDVVGQLQDSGVSGHGFLKGGEDCEGSVGTAIVYKEEYAVAPVAGEVTERFRFKSAGFVEAWHHNDRLRHLEWKKTSTGSTAATTQRTQA